MSKHNLIRFIYWAPRVLAIFFILFLAMFSLDVFDGGYGFWGTALALFMHNIPSLVLLVLLLIAWKHEIVGAIAFAAGGCLYIGLILLNALNNRFEWYMLSWFFIVAGPAFLVAFLFLLNWIKRKRNQAS